MFFEEDRSENIHKDILQENYVNKHKKEGPCFIEQV
jgi:hypothetical protein